MAALFGPAGLAALQRLAAARSLLSFDLDGTLAPIVGLPSDARVPAATARRLHALSRRWPVAVITGRAARDAADRLGFAPQYLFGNHGAERAAGRAAPLRGDTGRDQGDIARADTQRQRLDACHDQLHRQAAALHAHGISVEDKGLSVALHYRQATDPRAARACLERLVAGLGAIQGSTPGAGLSASFGHCVLNLTPAGAKDKGDALREALRECGAARALVIGDDENDEAGFVKSPPGSVSVRIGPAGTPTRARFRLARQAQIDELLAVLLRLRR